MEKRYMISDAAKYVDVESHVLRYWEDELDIQVPRNEMGHRYYTATYIELFKKVKELKESGFQLKAIKLLIPSLLDGEIVSLESVAAVEKVQTGTRLGDEENHVSHGEEVTLHNNEKPHLQDISASEKMAYFKQLMGEIVLEAVKKNNDEIKNAINDNGLNVSETVIKQVDYLLRIKEEQEEERFKKLDEVIRNYQTAKKEVAMATEKSKKKRWGK